MGHPNRFNLSYLVQSLSSFYHLLGTYADTIISYSIMMHTANQVEVLTLVLRSLGGHPSESRHPSIWKYKPLSKGQNTLTVKQRLSILNILLDAFNLVCNHHDIRWSWSSKLSPCEEHPCPSIPGILAWMLLKFITFNTVHYLMQYTCPSLNVPTGNTPFNPSLSLIPCYAKAAFLGNCSAIVM
jgi:hypothetical protein